MSGEARRGEGWTVDTSPGRTEQSPSGLNRRLCRQTNDVDVRARRRLLLLSAVRHGLGEIAELTLFDENSVLFWFDRYGAEGLAGLEDRPKFGRPPKSR